MVNPSVTFRHAALDEMPDGTVVLRGVIDPNSLHLLDVADYQREVLPASSINELVKAFATGRVPDVELGMRGDQFDARQDSVFLRDPVYIIDGLQRVTAAKFKLNKTPDRPPHLGAVVHFNTTEQWERERFRILNLDRTKLSPNVLLRNWRHDFPVIDSMHNLCSDKAFVLRDRICWRQRMRREELITATTFLKVVGRLHSHMGPATTTPMIAALASGLQRVFEKIGKNTMRDNVKAYFDAIDHLYGVRRVAFKEGAIYLRLTYMIALARVFSNHEDFWQGNRLFIPAALMHKLALFPIRDPNIIQLATSSGKAVDMLYILLVQHINSGKRTRRLRPRIVDYPELGNSNSHDNEEDDSAAAG